MFLRWKPTCHKVISTYIYIYTFPEGFHGLPFFFSVFKLCYSQFSLLYFALYTSVNLTFLFIVVDITAALLWQYIGVNSQICEFNIFSADMLFIPTDIYIENFPDDKTSFLYAKQRRHYLCSNGLNLIFRKVMLVNVLARKISFMNSSNFSKSQFNYRPLIWMSYSCEKIGKKIAAWKVPKIHLHDKQSSLNELLEKDAFILIQEGSFC